MADLGPQLTAFVAFPSDYTENLLLSALTSSLPSLSLTNTPPTEAENCPQLQWADYDQLYLDDVLQNPESRLISSYIYRKTLIRKHMLHTAIQEYLAKHRHRNAEKPSLLEKAIPRGWVIDIQFADELDELMMDELYDLKDDLDANLDLQVGAERKWFILKPGMSDKAQGIRMFSTEEELVKIFEEFEPESEDEAEEEGEDEEEEDNDEDDQENVENNSKLQELEKLAISDFPDDEPYEAPASPSPDSEEQDNTGVQTSQLRHFVIQEYVPRPILIDPLESTRESGLEGHKFHLRAYVLLSGTYKLYLAKTMLALFSDLKFGFTQESEEASDGEETGLDLRAHLTNTCLQTQSNGYTGPPEHLVKLYWDLLDQTLLSSETNEEDTLPSHAKVTQEWLDKTFDTVGDVVAETVKAAVQCGSFGLQLLPNAFEVFGVDLLLSFPPSSGDSSDGIPTPEVTLLEFNASPDYFQSGTRLRKELGDMFKGVVKLVIKPFFGLKAVDEDAEDEPEESDVILDTWKLIGEEQTRGEW